MANFFQGLVQAAPFAAQVVAQREAKQKQDLATAIANQRQQSEDNTKSVLANVQAGVGLANIGKINAETTKLGKTEPKVMRGPGGQLVQYDPDNPSGATSIGPAPIPKAPPAPVIGSPEWRSAKAYEASLRPAPQPSYTPFQGADPTTGQPVVRPFNTKTGAFGAPADVAPKPAAGGGAGLTGQTMQTLGRLGMSYNDLVQAIDQMDKYENTPGNLAKQTPLKQAMGAAAEAHPAQEAHGLMGALNNAAGAFVGAKAQQQLGADDPDYRTYLNNKQRVATAFTELLPRPNQQLLQLEKGLSGADVGWNPDLMRNIQGRRRGGLDVLKNILQQQGMLDQSGTMTGAMPGRGRGAPPPNVQHPANKNDRPGPPDIGAGTGGDPEAAWAAKNPPHAGESFEAYHARYLSGGAK